MGCKQCELHEFLELKDAAWERTSAALNLPTGNVAI